MKKVSFILLTLLLLLTPTVYAAKTTLNHAYWGSNSGVILWDTYSNDYWEGIQLKGTGTGKIELYDISSQFIYDMPINLNKSEGWWRFGYGNTGVKGIKFVMTSGTVWAVYADTTNYTINFTQPATPPPDPDPPPPDDGGGGTTDPPPDTGGTTPAAMTLSASDNGDGSSDLTWSPVTGAVSYELYIDGVKSEYTSQITTVTKDGSGTAYVKALDSSGNVIGQSNTITFDSTTGGGTTDPPPDGGTDPTECNECEKLAEMLACPEWDTYMGELTDAFAAALPPPPDWQEVANIMRDTIVPPLIAGMVNEVVPAMGAEMDRILGHPAPPPSISTPSVPVMDGKSGVNRPNPVDSAPPAQTYDLNSIPSVQVEADTTGGIDLTGADPIDSIPHNDADYMPMPGKETGGFTPTIQRPESRPTPTNQGTVEPPADSTPTPTTSTAPAPTPSEPSPDASVTPPPAPDMPMPSTP